MEGESAEAKAERWARAMDPQTWALADMQSGVPLGGSIYDATERSMRFARDAIALADAEAAEHDGLSGLSAVAAARNMRVLQGIAKVLGLPHYADVTAEAVSSAIARHIETGRSGPITEGWLAYEEAREDFYIEARESGDTRDTRIALDAAVRRLADRPGSRDHLDRMSEAIRALPEGTVMGRAIGVAK